MALTNALYRKWLKRLATGRKAKNNLRDPKTGGMCCLGHLAKVAGYEFDGRYIKGRSGYNTLPLDVCRAVGMSVLGQGCLADTNDHTKGFGIVIQKIKEMRKAGQL